MQNLKLKTQNLNKGFTLIELLIVIAIIGVLATLLMVNFVGVRQRARDAQRKSDLRQVQSALEIYRSDNGSYHIGTTSSVAELFACSPGPAPAACTGSAKCFGNDPNCTTIYMKTLPIDPSGLSSSTYNGGNYYYSQANGNYILAACLENVGDSQGIAAPTGVPSANCASGRLYVLYNP
jgi:prepilin-type N-terminal cleavage/methylation domain-containing protein